MTKQNSWLKLDIGQKYQEKLDNLFDRRKWTLWSYFLVAVIASTLFGLSGSLIQYSWFPPSLAWIYSLLPLFWLWLVADFVFGILPRYIKRTPQVQVRLVGFVGFFLPFLVWVAYLWFRRPSIYGDPTWNDYLDNEAALAILAIVMIPSLILLLLQLSRERRTIKGHDKKDLFQ